MFVVRLTAAAALVLSLGCTSVGPASAYRWLGGEGTAVRGEEGTGAMVVRWRRTLIPGHDSRYVPVEFASAALDPGRNRIYVGASDGRLRAYDSVGRRIYAYDVGTAIEAPTAVDRARDHVFIAAADGKVHALEGETGERLWVAEGPGVLRTEPVFTEDAVFVVTEDDVVAAIARDNGEVLWTYRREPAGDFHIAGHAGLLLDETRLMTGFSDGVVVSLATRDGSVLWERATDVDIEVSEGGAPTFPDVDTTPVLLDGTLYIASFHAGLYGLDPQNGSVLFRDEERTGITGMSAVGSRLLIASADTGLQLLENSGEGREVRWTRQIERGSPSQPVVTRQGVILYGESQGSLVALAAQSGQELGRLDGGNGFSAPAAVALDLGVVLSNGGDLICVRFRE